MGKMFVHIFLKHSTKKKKKGTKIEKKIRESIRSPC